MLGTAVRTNHSEARPEAQGALSRLSALAAAVRDHEDAQRGQSAGPGHSDLHLYRRLRQICGDFR
jgi:hypothetical protein